MTRTSAPLALFHPAVREWFSSVFEAPTRPQRLGWPAIARGESTLILAPTGSGKTLTAFLWCLNRLLFEPVPDARQRCRVLYVSPLKALAVDVERNLRAPLAGIANIATATGVTFTSPGIAIRTGDTPANERARFLRAPADILITTPESLFLLLTSRARERLAAVDTVIIDEIHALVPGKRGAHLALSLERLEALRASGGGRPAAAAADRPLGDAAAARRGGALSRRRDRSPSVVGAAFRRPRRAGRKAGPHAELHDEFGDAQAGARVSSRDHRGRLGQEAAADPGRGAGRRHGQPRAARSRCRADPPRSARRACRSGRRSIRGCSN